MLIMRSVICNELGNVVNMCFCIIIHGDLDANPRLQKHFHSGIYKLYDVWFLNVTYILTFVSMSTVFKTANFATAVLSVCS